MLPRTPRLTLREMSLDDLPFIAALLADHEVMRYWPRPHTAEESEEWIRRQIARYENDGCGYWLALLQVTGEPVGQAGVMMQEVDGEVMPGLGYIFDKPFWGQGLATEAARACLDWGLAKYPRVACLVRPENAPSLRVAERLGMQKLRETDYKGFKHIVFMQESAIPL